MRAMSVRWKIRDFLEAHHITPYRLMKTSGLAQGTIYRLVNNRTTGLNTDTLNTILDALGDLTGEPVDVSDVLEYQRED